MAAVIGCITNEHNLWLVVVAAMLCGMGSWVTAQLFERMTKATGGQRYGWLFLTALAAGVAIWCVHFVAMLGYDPGVPVDLDPTLTLVSLLIAVFGSTIGFTIAASGKALV